MKIDKSSRHIVFALLIALLIVVIWTGSAIYISKLIDIKTNPGAYGDAFGAINALFSGLALIGVIVAILLQKKELSLQMEELKKSVDAQENSAKALTLRLDIENRAVKIRALSALLSSYNNGLKILEERNMKSDLQTVGFDKMWPTIRKIQETEYQLLAMMEHPNTDSEQGSEGTSPRLRVDDPHR